MSVRKEPHNGRDTSGQFKVKREDVDDLRTEPEGATFIQDDVRLGGAVEDIGPLAGQRGAEIGEAIEQNRTDVERAIQRSDESSAT